MSCIGSIEKPSQRLSRITVPGPAPMVPNTIDKRIQLQFSSFLTRLPLLTHGASPELSILVTLPDPATMELRASGVTLTGLDVF